MNIQELTNESMFALIAPDGSIQTSSIAHDLPASMGIVKLMHKAGLGKSWHELKMQGFKFEHVIVSITSKIQ